MIYLKYGHLDADEASSELSSSGKIYRSDRNFIIAYSIHIDVPKRGPQLAFPFMNEA